MYRRNRLHSAPVRLADISESIYTDPEVQKSDPDYTHKVYFVFVCEIISDGEATNKDDLQIDCVWVDIDDSAAFERTFPRTIGENLREILNSDSPKFLGTEYIN